MKWLYIDVETIPDQTTSPDPESVEAPANYKDPAKIAEYKAKHAESNWLKTALNRWRCQVVAVSVIDDEMTEPLVFMGLEESNIFAEFGRWFEQWDDPTGPHPVFCGHNLVEFDLPILYLRAFKYGHKRLGGQLRPQHPKWGGPRHRDTLIAAGGEGKLSDLARFFGVKREPTIAGNEIWKAWQYQRFSEIRARVAEDALTQRAVAQAMRERGVL